MRLSQGQLAAGPIGTRGRAVNVPYVPTLSRERSVQKRFGGIKADVISLVCTVIRHGF